MVRHWSSFQSCITRRSTYTSPSLPLGIVSGESKNEPPSAAKLAMMLREQASRLEAHQRIRRCPSAACARAPRAPWHQTPLAACHTALQSGACCWVASSPQPRRCLSSRQCRECCETTKACREIKQEEEANRLW